MVNNLRVSCTIDNLKSIRAFVSKSLQDLSIPELEINMMVLAVDEICANLIIHSAPLKNQKYLDVAIKNESGGVAFEISDSDGFDVNTYQTPEIEELIKNKRKGGLGLLLVKKIMDTIELRKENNFTILRLFKRTSLAH